MKERILLCLVIVASLSVLVVTGCLPARPSAKFTPPNVPPATTAEERGSELSKGLQDAFRGQLLANGVKASSISFRGRELTWEERTGRVTRTLLNERGAPLWIWSGGTQQRFTYNPDGSVAKCEFVDLDGKVRAMPVPPGVPIKKKASATSILQ